MRTLMGVGGVNNHIFSCNQLISSQINISCKRNQSGKAEYMNIVYANYNISNKICYFVKVAPPPLFPLQKRKFLYFKSIKKFSLIDNEVTDSIQDNVDCNI